MKILLDENFPLPLYHRLRAEGYAVEFEDVASDYRGKVIISRVRQGLPIKQRVEIWFHAIHGFMVRMPSEKLFDLLETGEIVPWEIREL